MKDHELRTSILGCVERGRAWLVGTTLIFALGVPGLARADDDATVTKKKTVTTQTTKRVAPKKRRTVVVNNGDTQVIERGNKGEEAVDEDADTEDEVVAPAPVQKKKRKVVVDK